MTTGVQTVTGFKPTTDLGPTLVHEHVACATAGAMRSLIGPIGGVDGLTDRAVSALVEAHEAGVRTIVDATPFDLGRRRAPRGGFDTLRRDHHRRDRPLVAAVGLHAQSIRQ